MDPEKGKEKVKEKHTTYANLFDSADERNLEGTHEERKCESSI